MTDRRPSNANSQSAVPLSRPVTGAKPNGGSTAKCTLTIAREACRRAQTRHERLRDVRRHREHHASFGVERRCFRRRNSATCTRASIRAGEDDVAQARTEPDRRAAMLQQPQRRIDERAAQAVARDQRPAREAAGEQASRAPSRRSAPPTLHAARRSASRETAAAAGGPTAGRCSAWSARRCARAWRTAAARATDSRAGRVFGTRAFGSKIHHGRRPGDRRTVQRARVRQIHERILGLGRADQFVGGADRARVVERRVHCPTAPCDCRCRWSRPAWRRSTNGNGRPPAARLHAARRCAPRRCNCTAAARPARPAPITWTSFAISSEERVTRDDPQHAQLRLADLRARNVEAALQRAFEQQR